MLELLTEMAPGLKRVAILFNPDTAPGGGTYYSRDFGPAARSSKLEPIAARAERRRNRNCSDIAGRGAQKRPRCHAGLLHVQSCRVDHIASGAKQSTSYLSLEIRRYC